MYKNNLYQTYLFTYLITYYSSPITGVKIWEVTRDGGSPISGVKSVKKCISYVTDFPDRRLEKKLKLEVSDGKRKVMR